MSSRLAELAVFAQTGLLHDFSEDEFPAIISAWSDGRLSLTAAGTHFGFVGSGTARLSWDDQTYNLSEGMYFAVPHAAEISGTGAGFVVTRLDFRGFFHVGGPIETAGRLRYIDGCTDSLLIPPMMKGDPCLNLLHVPKMTDQTSHTHPSLRVGMIVSGGGTCIAPERSTDLRPGMIFHLPANLEHSFHTADQPMLIVAWHPDSDFGPTHEEHPMVNRTLVNGRKPETGVLPSCQGKGQHEVS